MASGKDSAPKAVAGPSAPPASTEAELVRARDPAMDACPARLSVRCALVMRSARLRIARRRHFALLAVEPAWLLGAGAGAASARRARSRPSTGRARLFSRRCAFVFSRCLRGRQNEADLLLKERLDALAEALVAGTGDLASTINSLASEIRSSTTTMTSVPKPLKFLRSHYERLVAAFQALPAGHSCAAAFADVLAVLAMAAPGAERAVLSFKLQGTPDLGSWGVEFIKALSLQIGNEFSERRAARADVADLMRMVDVIVPFNMAHHAEVEACDLLMEVERLADIAGYVDAQNLERVAGYMMAAAHFLLEPDDTRARRVVFDSYFSLGKFTSAARVAMVLNDPELLQRVYVAPTDPLVKKQIAYMYAAQRVAVTEDDDAMLELLGNQKLSGHFRTLARELDVLEPKAPEHVYKSHVETQTRVANGANVESARKSLADSIVSAFVNAGFGTDTLMTVPTASQWIYRNKEHGMTSAVASLGLIDLWDFANGTNRLDKFSSSTDTHIKAGYFLGVGLVNSGVRTSYNMTKELLEGPLLATTSDTERACGVLALGIAYAGQRAEDVRALLMPMITNASLSMEVASLAALAVALVYVGTCDSDIAESVFQSLLERSDADLASPLARYMGLSVGLLYLGQKEQVDVVLELAHAVPVSIRKVTAALIEACAYAGSGNVLKVQKMMHICADHLGAENAAHQAIAVLGIGLIAMGEDCGAEMAVRSFNNLLQYGEIEIRRAVPLVLGLMHASQPKMNVVDTLSKLSHDPDVEVAQSAVFALGLVGAGTNSSRVAVLLRELAAYYAKDANTLFIVRVAQGVLFMGKGLLTIHPYMFDRQLLNPVCLAGLLSVTIAALDAKSTLLGKWHTLLYLLAVSMRPRMLMTLDAASEAQVYASVRVGDAVDTVGAAGNPKKITGFQTNDTPVLLESRQRAEFANDAYIALAPVLEGVVLVLDNPDRAAEPAVAGAKATKS